MWAGVDVGGRRKGYHVAVVEERSLVAGPARLAEQTDVAEWLRSRRAELVAVDSPLSPAPHGLRSREAEPRWSGPKGDRTRAPWIRAAPADRGLDDLPTRLGQDDRDAIAAALTARAHARGKTEAFGEIVVPVSPR